MNQVNVTITDIHKSGGVILVDMEVAGHALSALLIDITDNPAWLVKGNALTAIFKETEVSLAKELSGKLSIRNKIPCIVKEIELGELLSLVTLDFSGNTIRSAISTRSVDMLELKPGDEVLALIKANELALMQ